MIILTDFTGPDKISKIRKAWLSSNPQKPDCLVETNLVGSNHFEQVVIGINSFYLTFFIKTNTFLIEES